MDKILFKYCFQARLKILFSLVIIVFFILLIKIFYLQVIEHKSYKALSNKNSIKVIPLPPNRGIIFDRNNKILADNKLSFTLELNRKHKVNFDTLAYRFKDIIEITDRDIKNYKERISKYYFFDTSPIKFNLTNIQVAKIISQNYKYPEFIIKQGFVRNYPLGKSSAHLIGYINRININDIKNLKKNGLYGNYRGSTHIGKSGIEKYYEKKIHGKSGYKKIEVDANQNLIRTIQTVPAISGENIYLTIDSRLQKIAEKEFNNRKGALVAIDPNNGEILAYVSQPTFDPSLFTNGISQENWLKLNDKKNRPLLDRVISGAYPPGSTLKPFVGLAALHNNVRVPPFSIVDPGFYTMPNGSKTFKDWKKGGHGNVDLIKAIAVSCDTFFYGLGIELGIPNINNTLDIFGFGKKTLIDMGNEKKGLLADKKWKKNKLGKNWYQGETAITAIGQGYTLVTPIQLAYATAKIANEKYDNTPHLRIDLNNNINESKDDKSTSTGIINSFRKKNIDLIKLGMQRVTETEGTAAFLGKTSSYKIAAKTGTAQVFGLKKDEVYDEKKLPDRLKDHALFIAYAPAENPRLAIAIIVENGGHGGSTAGPIAKKVFDTYLDKNYD